MQRTPLHRRICLQNRRVRYGLRRHWLRPRLLSLRLIQAGDGARCTAADISKRAHVKDGAKPTRHTVDSLLIRAVVAVPFARPAVEMPGNDIVAVVFFVRGEGPAGFVVEWLCWFGLGVEEWQGAWAGCQSRVAVGFVGER